MLKKLIALLILLPSLSFAAEFIAGKDYQILPSTPETTTTPPSITEFFSYGCPWCYRIEQPLNAWIKSEDKSIHFERIPVVFKKSWENYAKAYYTAQALLMTDTLSPLLFKAIQDDKTPLDTTQSMIEFFVSHGVDKTIAESAFEHSPGIDLRINNGTRLMASYQINAVPAFVVNNHYKTDLQMAQDPARLLKILTYLLTNPA